MVESLDAAGIERRMRHTLSGAGRAAQLAVTLDRPHPHRYDNIVDDRSGATGSSELHADSDGSKPVVHRAGQFGDQASAREEARPVSASEEVGPGQTEIDEGKEVDGLRHQVTAIAVCLAAIAAVTGAVAMWLSRVGGSSSVIEASGIGLSAGAAGSAVAALLSLSNRSANGWELSDGTKRPTRVRDGIETFNSRLGPLFLQRPLLGAFTGWTLAMGLLDGPFQVDDISTVRVCFWALVAGFFAKTVLDTLKSAVKGFVGRS